MGEKPMDLVMKLLVAYDETADDRFEEAAACIREMVEWRPIETAPRDGALFLSLNTRQNNLMCIVWFHPAYKHFVGTGGQHLYQFTHWLPLPPAPGAEDE